MRRNADDGQYGQSGIDFFISYSPSDIRWAEWIAWQLELAGYRTLLQAWDFVPGTNFIDFMDRGVSDALAVVAVLSRAYMRSNWARMEWQAAMRSSPERPADRLITVRVEDFPITGLLATITFVDLVAVDDPAVARRRLLTRIGDAVNGRAKPREQPRYPRSDPVFEDPDDADGVALGLAEAHPRLRTRPPVTYPPRHSGDPKRSVVRLLHVAGLGLAPGTARRMLGDFEIALGTDPEIDVLLIGGDLTAAGGIRDFDEALNFVIGLRRMLHLSPHRVALVPGPDDLTLAASRAYFNSCEADEIEPEPPYWPKWRHYARFFDNLYDGVDGVSFTEQQPWSLFEMADLRIVVAGLNATMADSHLGRAAEGTLGRAQEQWFARALRRYPEPEWLRIGLAGGDRPLVLAAENAGLVLPSPPPGEARLLTARRGDAWSADSQPVPIADVV
ncbi:toll/interleukin-1 receptor domain-containing protein [Actinoplanes sp. CA-030573]|uniref:toll/interleukin-1 receptor domain-containing protein n=1 Tax=Actinoplanes sp. CA-030573 TaxID=3239898 RepID=UPI003D91EE09